MIFRARLQGTAEWQRRKFHGEFPAVGAAGVFLLVTIDVAVASHLQVARFGRGHRYCDVDHRYFAVGFYIDFISTNSLWKPVYMFALSRLSLGRTGRQGGAAAVFRSIGGSPGPGVSSRTIRR